MTTANLSEDRDRDKEGEGGKLRGKLSILSITVRGSLYRNSERHILVNISISPQNKSQIEKIFK